MTKNQSDEFIIREENGLLIVEPYENGVPWMELDPEIFHEITGWRLRPRQKIKVVLVKK